MNAAERLFGWTPFRVSLRADTLWVDWCHLDLRRMTEPFHFETIVQAMRDPFNLAFQQHTPEEALDALPPGLPVAGFVFHMSRCGSTLISQALAALESLIVVSEATPLRSVLRAHAVGRGSYDATVARFRGLVNAYAQPRFSYEKRVVVKFMAADVLDIALVREAFPHVPWIFVTRDPAEILASQDRQGGIDLARGQIPAARLGLTEEAMWAMERHAYRASVLARLAEAGLAAQGAAGEPGRGLVIDHRELPDAIWTKVLPHFGLAPDPGAVALMKAVSGRHSKRPGEPFQSEADPNRGGAAAFRSVAEAETGAIMAALARAGSAA